MSHFRRYNNHKSTSSLSVAFVAFFLAAGPALAAHKPSKPDKQSQENAARTACLDGNYAEGVAILSKLFVGTKNVTYIFNQGRCFEQNRQYQDAIARFQEYLRAGRKTLDANDKAEAEQHITDCKEMLAQERGTSPTPTAPQPLVASPPSRCSDTGGPADPRVFAFRQPSCTTARGHVERGGLATGRHSRRIFRRRGRGCRCSFQREGKQHGQ
jgi:hypothetical protein